MTEEKDAPSYIDAADVIGAQLLKKRRTSAGLNLPEAQMIVELAKMEAQTNTFAALEVIAAHLQAVSASLAAVAWNLAPEEVRREATRQAQAAEQGGRHQPATPTAPAQTTTTPEPYAAEPPDGGEQ